MKRHAPRILVALLAAALATGLLAVPAAHASAAAACTSANVHAPPAPGAIKLARGATLCLLNRERRARGLRPLRMSRRLSRAAVRHSRNMVRRNFFAHGNFVARILNARYAGRRQAWSLGENIAWGTGSLASPAKTVDAWMRSPGHRANILSRRFRDIGVGIVLGTPAPGVGGAGAATYTTDFGRKG